MLSKNVNNKKCAPKLIFFNEKKIEKDLDNFWYRKLTLKVKRLGDFALFDTSPLTQFSKFYKILWVCWFVGKNLSNFVPPLLKLHNPYCHNGETRTETSICTIFYTYAWSIFRVRGHKERYTFYNCIGPSIALIDRNKFFPNIIEAHIEMFG